jgi:hypothetical protein
VCPSTGHVDNGTRERNRERSGLALLFGVPELAIVVVSPREEASIIKGQDGEISPAPNFGDPLFGVVSSILRGGVGSHIRIFGVTWREGDGARRWTGYSGSYAKLAFRVFSPGEKAVVGSEEEVMLVPGSHGGNSDFILLGLGVFGIGERKLEGWGYLAYIL